MAEKPREILVIHNPRSRRGAKASRRARELLEREGRPARASWIEIGALPGLPAPVRPPERIIAIGGDGTVNAAAWWAMGGSSGEVHRGPSAAASGKSGPTVLGIVPAGTGNNLARELGLPPDPEQALRLAISGGRTRRIDAVRYRPLDGETPADPAAERVLIQSGQLGFPAEINARFHRLRKNRLFRAVASPLGLLIYRILALTGLAAASRRERRGGGKGRLHLRASDPGGDMEADVLAVFVGNGCSLGGGFQPCPRAVLDDGLMDLCLIRSGTGHSYLGLFRDVLRGRHLLREGAVVYHQTPGPLDLHFSRPSEFLADGDIWMTARSYRLEMIPGALAVVVGE